MRVEQDQLRRQRDPLLVGVVIVVGLLAVGLAGWLLIGALTTAAPDRVAVEVDNQTALTLEVEAVDAAGTALALGRMPPGQATMRQELPAPASNWTFVAYFGDQEVWRSEPVTPEEVSGGYSVRIDPTPQTRELEGAGFR